MSVQRMPLRVMLLIAVHVVSTVVLVALTWTFVPEAEGAIITESVFWPRHELLNLMPLQIYLVVFWICLGNSAWVRRLVVGLLILGVMVGVSLDVILETANWAWAARLMLVQLLVIAVPLLALRLTGRKLVEAASNREIGVSSLRWSLKDMLVAMTLGTSYVALLRYLDLGLLDLDRVQLSVTSAIFPMVGLSCVVPVFFAVRLWKLLLVMIVLEAILTAVISWINARWFVEGLRAMISSGLLPPEPAMVREILFRELPRVAQDVSFATVILCGSLLVVRSCGYRWARCDDD